MVPSRSSPGSGPALQLHFYCSLLALCLWTRMHVPFYACRCPVNSVWVKERESSATVIFSRWRHRSNMWRREVLAAAGEIRRHPVDAEERHGSSGDFDSHPGGGSSCQWFKGPTSCDRPALLPPNPPLCVPDGRDRWRGRRGAADLQKAKMWIWIL